MIKKIFALTLAFLFLLNVSVLADSKKTKSKKTPAAAVRQINQLVASLPASDGVAFLDVQRLLNEAMPQILAANPQKLAEVNAKIDEIKSRVGLDLREFEKIAVGVVFRQATVDPLILARGKYNADQLVMLARNSAVKDRIREEKIGGRTVYVFPVKEILAENKAKAAGGSENKIFDLVFGSLPADLAVTTFDAKTVAIGSLARLRESFESKTKVSAGVLALVNRKPDALISFGANTPTGLAQFFELDDDDLGQSLGSIRQIYGAASLSGGNMLVSVSANLTNATQADSLKNTLEGLQALGRGLLGGLKGTDKKIYAGMLENLKITRSGTEILLNLQVPNTDLALLLN